MQNCLRLMDEKHREEGVEALEDGKVVKYVVLQGLYSPLQVRYPISMKTWPLHKYVENENAEEDVG